jgi:hypothetical protein
MGVVSGKSPAREAGAVMSLLSKTTRKWRFGRVKSFVLNMALFSSKAGLRNRYDPVQNGAGKLAMGLSHRNAPEAAILAHFEGLLASPAV